MDLKLILESYPILFVSGVVIVGITLAYLVWHFLFMVAFPIKRFAQTMVKSESFIYNPQLGFTLADGGEKIDEEKGAKDE